MKLSEAMLHAGWTKLMQPGTYNNTQVVQPRTRQAFAPEQGLEYEKAKKKNKEQEKIDIEKYNDKETDDQKIYYDDESDALEKKFNKIMSKMKKAKDLGLRGYYRDWTGDSVSDFKDPEENDQDA